MRTTEEFREKQLQALPPAITRPAMVCPTAIAAELFLGNLLRDLCWIDERDKEWCDVERLFLWGSRRVLGQLLDQRVMLPDCTNEVVSIYAQVAHALGYFQPTRLRSFRARDHHHDAK